jgi:hypothetical protein
VGVRYSVPVQTGPGAHLVPYKMGTGIKRPRRGVNHPTPSSAEVKVRVELHLYTPSGPSRPLLWRTSLLRLTSTSLSNSNLNLCFQHDIASDPLIPCVEHSSFMNLRAAQLDTKFLAFYATATMSTTASNKVVCKDVKIILIFTERYCYL